jgi:HEAT repeat protein
MSLYQHARDGNAERLRDAMGSDSAAVRKRAAEFLGEVADHGDQPSIDVLLRAATGDEDAQVRGGAVDALDEIGEAALEQLLSELTGTKGSEAEWVTARKFARALQADRPELRMAAANALGRLDDGSGLQHLVEALDDEELPDRTDTANEIVSDHADQFRSVDRTDMRGLVDQLTTQVLVEVNTRPDPERVREYIRRTAQRVVGGDE